MCSVMCLGSCGLGIGTGVWPTGFRTRAAIDRTSTQDVRPRRQDVRLASLFRCLASWVQVEAKRQDPGYRTSARGQDSNQDTTKNCCGFNAIGASSNEVVVESVGIVANPERMCSKSVGSRAD